MAVLLDCMRLHQLAATTRPQVDKTCPMGYIFFHVFIQSSFNEINQSDTSAVDSKCKRFNGIVRFHGITQQWTFSYPLSLDAYFRFKILGRLLRYHVVSRLMMMIDPKYSGVPLIWLWGGGASPTIGRHIIYPWHSGWELSTCLPMAYQVKVVPIISSTQRIAGGFCHLIYPAYRVVVVPTISSTHIIVGESVTWLFVRWSRDQLCCNGRWGTNPLIESNWKSK